MVLDIFVFDGVGRIQKCIFQARGLGGEGRLKIPKIEDHYHGEFIPIGFVKHQRTSIHKAPVSGDNCQGGWFDGLMV